MISVYDGRSTVAPLIAQLCNKDSFVQIISSGQDLYVEFKTGSNPTPFGRGFSASYAFEPLILPNTSNINGSKVIAAPGSRKKETTRAPGTGKLRIIICNFRECVMLVSQGNRHAVVKDVLIFILPSTTVVVTVTHTRSNKRLSISLTMSNPC